MSTFGQKEKTVPFYDRSGNPALESPCYTNIGSTVTVLHRGSYFLICNQTDYLAELQIVYFAHEVKLTCSFTLEALHENQDHKSQHDFIDDKLYSESS